MINHLIKFFFDINFKFYKLVNLKAHLFHNYSLDKKELKSNFTYSTGKKGIRIIINV